MDVGEDSPTDLTPTERLTIFCNNRENIFALLYFGQVGIWILAELCLVGLGLRELYYCNRDDEYPHPFMNYGGMTFAWLIVISFWSIVGEFYFKLFQYEALALRSSWVILPCKGMLGITGVNAVGFILFNATDGYQLTDTLTDSKFMISGFWFSKIMYDLVCLLAVKRIVQLYQMDNYSLANFFSTRKLGELLSCRCPEPIEEPV